MLGYQLQNETLDDTTRLTMEAGLFENGQTVIPALVNTAEFPAEAMLPETIRSLVHQNGLRIRHDPHFDRDVTRLLNGIRRPASLSEPPTPRKWAVAVLESSFGRMVLGAVVFAIAFLVVLALSPMALGWLKANDAIGVLILSPVVVGLIVGGRHGVLGGTLGLTFGLLGPSSTILGDLSGYSRPLAWCESRARRGAFRRIDRPLASGGFPNRLHGADRCFVLVRPSRSSGRGRYGASR